MMKFQAPSLLVAVLGLLLSLARTPGQDTFQNLDFEMATVTPAPPGYAPLDAYPPISAADALPY
jgi:hypothetical protein